MKKLLLALAATTALTGSAFAADMSVPRTYAKAPAPLAVAPSWTGCYVAAGWGYGLLDDQRHVSTSSDSLNRAKTDSGGKGWLGSVGGGCDYQFGGTPFGPIVVGVFGDYDPSSIKGSFEDPRDSFKVGTQKLADAWFAGGRVGLVVTPNLLTYVNGGWTGAHVNQINFLFPDSSPTGLSLPSANVQGWFLGSGVEYAFTFLPIQGLFWKNEYRYATYSNYNQNYLHDGIPGSRYTVHNSLDTQTFTTSLVWRFNWTGSPVVAKY